jgi:RimJ/RimL family protein N-acetyltransferase
MSAMDIRPLVLEGRHARLEPLAMAHLDALGEALDPTLLQWSSSHVKDVESLRGYIAEALAAQTAGTALPFATIARAGGRPVGSTRFGNIDRANRRVEIGWTWLGRPWQRTALNTEAKLLMMTHAFEAWGAIRVEFKTDALNAQSRAALRRLGAVEEGVFRSHMIMADGRIRDSVWYGVTAGEWPAIKRRLQSRLAEG